MRGEAGVESQLGLGSTFWFTAHLQRGREQTVEAASVSRESAETELRIKHAGARLLLAEDNLINREVALELLSRLGLHLETASNGLEAVEKARNQRFDLILMDVQMPDLDGLNATRIIRTLPGLQEIPILAMTANAFDEDRQQCLNVGMNDFVSKPVDPPSLYSTLLKWLSTPASNTNVMPKTGGSTYVPNWHQHLLEIPGLDAQGGLTNVGDSLKIYLKIWGMLVEHHGDDGRLITKALSENDLAEVQRLTHKLKGAIGNLGATRIVELVDAIYLAIKQGVERVEIDALCNTLVTDLNSLINSVQNVLTEAGRAD